MKKTLFIITIIASVFVINNLVRSIYSLWQKQHLLGKAEKQLQEEKKRNETLKNQLKTVENPEFVEKEARNKLFLAKPGESQVILPHDDATASKAAQNTPSFSLEPNWKQWWEVFFGYLTSAP